MLQSASMLQTHQRDDKLHIILNGHKLSVEPGSSIAELLPQAPHTGKFPALGAIIRHRLVSLGYKMMADATVDTIDLTRREGMDIYRRTASSILYAAFFSLAPEGIIEVGQSIANGYFFEIHNHVVDQSFLKHLDARMREIVQADFPIIPQTVTIEDAMERFTRLGANQKVKLLKQLRRSEVPIVSIGQSLGIMHGPMAYRTGVIDIFKLHPYEHGLVLEFPDEHGTLLGKMPPQPKLFATYLETKRWNQLVETSNIADLNEHVRLGTISDLVKVCEGLHEKKIAAIADQIAANPNLRLIMIAGPSSSGKTTFAKRLRIQLKIHGIEPVSISIDNYYRPREETPKHPDGSYDFEALEALDIDYFNQQVDQLLHGEEVHLPIYSFPMGMRDPRRSIPMRLGKGQVLITEGIHGLNEKLTSRVPQSQKFKIFVSALTQLCVDGHNRIFTTDTRLCRRIVRDRLFRNTNAAETIAGWPSVRAGETKYIFPYQEDADVIFNSALVYEHALLKPYLERYLFEVQRDHPSFMEATRIARFLRYVVPILAIEVPHDSILREFIGGSAFRY